MADSWVLPELVFDGETLRPAMALGLSEGVVRHLCPAAEVPIQDGPARQLPGILAPGFVDLQVNGGGGVLLNTDPTPAGMAAIATAHRPFGTTGILPTVITDRAEVLARAVDASIDAAGVPGMLGLHIEGPHIALARRGTHAAEHVRPMEPATMAHVRRLREAGIPVMITLAPEAATAAEIRALSETGAVVSIGHTDADAARTRAALAAGATCATHLFNAMPPLLSRAPGAVGAILNSQVHAGLIADGIHVADEMLALAIRARPVSGRMFLVSDAMPTVGGPDSFDLYGQRLEVSEGRLVNADGNLAGAHLTMAAALRRMVDKIGLPPEEALQMAITVPARLMGLGHLASPLGLRTRDLISLNTELDFIGYPFG